MGFTFKNNLPINMIYIVKMKTNFKFNYFLQFCWWINCNNLLKTNIYI